METLPLQAPELFHWLVVLVVIALLFGSGYIWRK